MKKVLFFTAKVISHIHPIMPFLRALAEENEVYCAGILDYQGLIEETGATYVAYPDDFFIKEVCKRKTGVIEKCDDDIQTRISRMKEAKEITPEFNEDLHQLIYTSIKKQAAKLYGFNRDRYRAVKDIIERMNPDVIFRDSLDFYAGSIAKAKNIKCVSYLTNNMYSFEYLNSSKKYLYSHFFRITEFASLLSNDFYDSLEQKVTEIFMETAEELEMPSLPPFYSHNLNDDFNLIYSLPSLHPPGGKYEKEGKKYLFIPPIKASFELDRGEITCLKLREFIEVNKQEQIVYLATGSFWVRESFFYTFWVSFLLKKGFKVIVSWNPDSLKFKVGGLRESSIEDFENFAPEEVFVGQNLPQKYILNNADIFLTSGGWNSVLESIYYSTPMLLSPFTPEQNMTGLFMEELGVGVTLFKQREKPYSAEDSFSYFLSKIPEIKEKMSEIRSKYCEANVLKSIAGIVLAD